MIKPYNFPILMKSSTIYLILMIFFFLFNDSNMIAQEHSSIDGHEFCGTPPPKELDPPGVYSRSIDPLYLNNFEPVSFNIFFWGIAKDDGTWTSQQMTLQTAQNAVALLNEHFGPFNICFNLVGMDIIKSTPHHLGSTYINIRNFANANGYVKENSYNIYAPEGFDRPGGAPTGITNNFSTKIGIRVCCVVHPTFIHEMGHTFNLHHTFGNNNVRPDPVNCERVTRDINHPDYNATTSGDMLHDTYAVPNFLNEQHNYVAYAVEEANIGYSWTTARNDIAFSPNGFNNFSNALAIEQALIDYGFTTAEINHLKFNPAIHNAYYDLATKTYTPDSRINDPNSPFFKDCQGNPYQINTTDVRNFMAYTHSSSKELFTTGQGIRMQEAINNFSNNSQLLAAIPQYPIDLYVRDHEGDIGQEPNIHTEVFWHSPDIWVRNYADGGQTHQNPNYATNPNYVYVRVKNKSCVSSTGDETLELRWAKADTGIGGAALWTGTATGGPNNVPLGGLVGTLNIPVIAPGDEAVLQFTWAIPNPEDYFGITVDDWHYCLMTRIIAANDPMASPNHPWNSRLNNNIASKNVTVVNTAIPPTGKHNPGGTVSIGNISGVIAGTFGFDFFTNETGSTIFEEAEIRVTLSDDAFERWMMGGSQTQGIRLVNEEKREFKITGNNARLNNIQYGPGEWSTLYLSFNFLTEEVTGKDTFEYHLIQRNAVTGEIVGGEVFQIIRNPERELFTAQGSSYENTGGEIEMVANDIGEPAIYNWYAPEGDLIYSGKEFTFFPEIPGDYLLEVIAETDGHKDYFNLTLAVNAAQDQIISLSPNPASNAVEAQYQISANATNASLNILSFFGNINTSHPIDLNNMGNTLNINLNGYPAGHYAVILQINGQAVHAKQLIIN